ncbi:MAG: YbaK/EbsC family protein [Anaeromyxobacter sp.]
MIPDRIDRYLRDRELPYVHSVHMRAVAAQRLAHAEHVTGDRIAKPVVVSLDGRLALAVVSASQHVDVEALRRVTGARVARLADEDAFAGRFDPCEAGAEPALGLFGLPLFVDGELAREPWLVMRAGTHEDAITVDTAAWIAAESPTPVDGLGRSLN